MANKLTCRTYCFRVATFQPVIRHCPWQSLLFVADAFQVGLDNGLEIDFVNLTHVRVLFFPNPKALFANVLRQKTTAV